MIIPTVLDKDQRVERAFDIFSKLLKERIVFLGSEIDDPVANLIVAELLYLNHEDQKTPINMYINSPGGMITSGMAIMDTMHFIQAPVHTCVVGQAASMGALLLAAGEKGYRYALPHSNIMIHQPSGGYGGQATDIEIHTAQILKVKKKMNELLASFTGQTIETVQTCTERDNFMSPEEAQNFGLIDQIWYK